MTRRIAWLASICLSAGVSISASAQSGGTTCQNAFAVGLGTVQGTLNSDFGVGPCGVSEIASGWFRFTNTSSCDRVIRFDTNGSSVLNDGADTVLGLFLGCGGNPIICDNDGGSGTDSQAQVAMQPGQTIFIRVGARGSIFTNDDAYRLTVSLVDEPDADGDGVCDALDACPGGDDTLDGDGDGVPDDCDVCDGDNASGDSDGDGVCDDVDQCPGVDDGIDSDGDGQPDCVDSCPDDPNVVNADTGAIYARFKEAIAGASEGDTLELGPCTFFERNFTGAASKSLTIRGSGMGQTIIDAENRGRMFVFGSEDVVLIEDMTLQNARGEGTGGGGAIFANRADLVTVRRVEILGGTVRPNGVAGAIFAAESPLVIDSCRIVNNTAQDSGARSIVHSQISGRLEIVNTLFEGNISGTRVIRKQNGGRVTVVNSTFVGNDAAAIVSVGDGATARIFNCVSDQLLVSDSGDVLTQYNVFPGGSGLDINVVPTFIDSANSDCRLTPGTPGVDAADLASYAAIGGGFFDLSGDDRIIDDPSIPNALPGLPIDAGAFESPGAPASDPCPADLVIPFGFLDLDDIDAFIVSFTAGCP